MDKKIKKATLIYFTQSILIYIVVIACLINLSIGLDNQSLWASLLSGSLGYMLPSPGAYIKRKKEKAEFIRDFDCSDGNRLPNNGTLLHASAEQ